MYNDIERDLQATSGVADANKIIVTGMPRMDRIHRWRRIKASHNSFDEKRTVLFFAFDENDKLPMSNQKRELPTRWGSLSWGKLCEEAHLAISRMARKRPDVEFLVKTKANSRHRDQVKKMILGDGGNLPDNIRIISGGDPFEIIAHSSVVFAFNTTGQLEALAAGKPVVTPNFAEAVQAGTREFVIDLGDAVEYANKPDEIDQIIFRLLDEPATLEGELRPEVCKALREWAGNDDGAAGKRVLDVIRSEVLG